MMVGAIFLCFICCGNVIGAQAQQQQPFHIRGGSHHRHGDYKVNEDNNKKNHTIVSTNNNNEDDKVTNNIDTRIASDHPNDEKKKIHRQASSTIQKEEEEGHKERDNHERNPHFLWKENNNQNQQPQQDQRSRRRRSLSFLSFSPSTSSPDDNITVTTDVSFEEILYTMIFLMLVAIVGKCMEFISIPSLVGEMLVGMLLGPRLANFVPFPEALVIIGYLGLITMMLEFGIEVDIAQLKLNGIRCAVAAVIGALVALGVAWGMGRGFGLSNDAGFALGASFAPTSTGIAANVLDGGGLLNTPVGQFVVTAGIFDDTVGLILLAELQAVASPGNNVWQYVAPIISAVAWVLILGYSAMTWLPRFITNHVLVHFPKPHRASVGFVCMLLLSLIYMCAMDYTKASYLTGAFLAGLTFSEVTIVHKTFVKRTRNLFDWMTRIFFAASIAFQVPVRLFANPNVIGGGFILFIPVLSKVFMGLFLPRRSNTHHSSTSSKKKQSKPNDDRNNPSDDVVITSFDENQNNVDPTTNAGTTAAQFHMHDDELHEHEHHKDDRPDGFPFNPNIRDSLITGLALTCRGEMNFIVGAFGVQAKLFTPELYASMVWAVLLSTVLCPIALQTLVAYYHNLESRYVDETLPQWHYDDGRVPLYLSIQSRSMVSMGLYQTYKQTIQNLGLKVIDYRTWHPRGLAAMTTLVMELYVQDTKVSLIRHSTTAPDTNEDVKQSQVQREEDEMHQQQHQNKLQSNNVDVPIQSLAHQESNNDQMEDEENAIIEARCDEIRKAIMAILNEKAEVQVSQWKVDQVGVTTDSSSSSSERSSSLMDHHPDNILEHEESRQKETTTVVEALTSVMNNDTDATNENSILVPMEKSQQQWHANESQSELLFDHSEQRGQNEGNDEVTGEQEDNVVIDTSNNNNSQHENRNDDHPLLNEVPTASRHDHHHRGHHRRQSTTHTPVLAKGDLWNDVTIQAELAAATASEVLDDQDDYDERIDLHQPCRYGIPQYVHHHHHHRHHHSKTTNNKQSVVISKFKPHRSRTQSREENDDGNNMFDEITLSNLSMPTTAERLTGIVRYNKMEEEKGGTSNGIAGTSLLRRRHRRKSVIVAELPTAGGLRRRTTKKRNQSIIVAELPERRKQSQQQQRQHHN